MIDWKRRCFELATIVDRHRKERMLTDRKEAWEMARKLLTLYKLENKSQEKFMAYWREPDKKKAQKLYQEYLDIIGIVQ